MAAAVSLRCLLGALAAAACTLAGAQTLVDPTLPPPWLRAYGDQHGGPRADRGSDETAPEAGAPARALQMIVRLGDTHSALINGRLVKAGDTVDVGGGSARIARIDAAAVVLSRNGRQQVLELLPDASKTVTAASARCPRPTASRNAPSSASPAPAGAGACQ
jgi:hypothetical protein